MADKLTDQVMTALRKENRELEVKNRSLQSQVSNLENNRLRDRQRAHRGEEVMTILYDAVRILADEVPNTTAKGRKARERARQVLEQSGVTPPGTLGSSRTRSKKKGKKRKA